MCIIHCIFRCQTHLVRTFFSIQLVGSENYNLWSMAMILSLTSKNNGFIDGSCSKDSLEKQFHPLWEWCNALALSWIVNSVSKELVSGILYSEYSTCLEWPQEKGLTRLMAHECITFTNKFQHYVEEHHLYQAISHTWSNYRKNILLLSEKACVIVPRTKPTLKNKKTRSSFLSWWG